MHVEAVKTRVVTTKTNSLEDILDEALPVLKEGSIVAVTSKIVAICEGSVVPYGDISKEDLVISESDLYMPFSDSSYGYSFTITDNKLIPMAGIDESNGEGYYILWPRNPQQTANRIRHHLALKYKLQKVGVIVTDSTCQPLKRGTTGVSLAHSGFHALRNYIGAPDLFGRPFGVTQANLAEGLAASAVFAMGEGAERTPLCVITDAPNILFIDRDPTDAELSENTISLKEDLFAPFLTKVDWKKGGGKTRGQ